MTEDEIAIEDTPEDLQAEEAALEAELSAFKKPSSLTPVAQADTTAATPVDGPSNNNKAPAEGSGTQSAQQNDQQEQGEQEAPKAQSKYDKALERQNRSWAKLNEEKAALEQQRQELSKLQAAPPKPDDKPTPERFEEVAKDLEADGEFGQAALARKLAAERRAEIAAETAAAAAPAKIYPDAKFEQMAAQAFQQAKQDFPEIGVPNSPLNQAVKALIASEAPVAELIKTSPYGLYFATRYAATHAQAARVPDLEAKVATITAELAQLRSQTSPISDPLVNQPGRPSGSRFSDLSIDEMEQSIEAELYAGR